MLYIHNLELIVTKNCNLACRHCMRGESENKEMNLSLLHRLFKRKMHIETLYLNGGEVFYNPKVLSDTINEIIKNNILLNGIVITTNGTLYTGEIICILKKALDYIEECNKN